MPDMRLYHRCFGFEEKSINNLNSVFGNKIPKFIIKSGDSVIINISQLIYSLVRACHSCFDSRFALVKTLVTKLELHYKQLRNIILYPTQIRACYPTCTYAAPKTFSLLFTSSIYSSYFCRLIVILCLWWSLICPFMYHFFLIKLSNSLICGHMLWFNFF